MAMVLVVDDDRELTEVLRLVLEEEGYTVHTAVGAAAIPLALALQPAVILLNLHMPGMDGLEVARHLRADARTRAIPIVLTSATNKPHARVGDAPVDAVLAKPFDLDTLLALVERLAAPRAGAWGGRTGDEEGLGRHP